MNIYYKSGIIALLLAGFTITENPAQENLYSLDECISYALVNSTTMGRARNQIESGTSALEQLKAQRGPNLLLSGNEIRFWIYMFKSRSSLREYPRTFNKCEIMY